MYTYKITVDRVVDGDTIDANIDLGFDVSVKKRIRFMGVNAPESRTRDAEEKVKGLAAKERVKSLYILRLDNHHQNSILQSDVGPYSLHLLAVYNLLQISIQLL